MNKINENDNNTNKTNEFKNRLAMFDTNKNNTEIKNKEDENNIKENKLNKNISSNKNNLNNDDKKQKNEKIEEKPKETNNVLNFANQINKKEELNKKKDNKNFEKLEKIENKNEKFPIRNSSFQENRKIFESGTKETKNIKEKSDIKNNKEKKEQKDKIDINNKNTKEIIGDSYPEKKKAQKKEINNNEDKKNINENSDQKIIKINNENRAFKNILNIFDKPSNNEIKNENNNIEKEINNNFIRNRSITFFDSEVNKRKQEPEIKTNKVEKIVNKIENNTKTNEKMQKIKSENISVKEKKDIKDEKISNKKENNKKEKEKKEIQRNENKENIFSKNQQNIIKDKENENNNKNKAQDIPIKENKEENSKNNSNTNLQKNNLIQQRIMDMNKKSSDNKKQEPQTQPRGRIDSSILEKLKLFYNPDNKDKNQKQSTTNNNLNNNMNNMNLNIRKNNSSDNNFNMNNNKNSGNKNKEEEKKISENNNNDIIENKIINSNIKEKEKEIIIEQKSSNKIKEDNMIITNNAPKKLNLKEIFKNLGVAEVASNVKANKREEIMNIAQKKKEEEKNQDILNEVESDNENDNEEKEKEEEMNEEENIENNIDMENQELEENNNENDIHEPNNEENNIDNIKNNSNKENIIKEEVKRQSTLNKRMEISLNLQKMLSQRKINDDNNNFGISKSQNKIIEAKSQNKIVENNIYNIDINLDYEDYEDIENNNKEINQININNENYKNINIENETKIKIIQNTDSNPVLQEENDLPKHFTKSIGFNNNKYINDKINNKINESPKKVKDLRNTIAYKNKHKSISLESDNDFFLDDIEIPQNKQLKNDLFCECFFLTSFPKENGKLMENSEDFQAECTHIMCSMLPAMQPEIIYKYPKEDIKGLEINNLAASICYPNGIKLCYESEEKYIKTVKNYRSSFTNQVGERFFAVIYHFYLKMDNNEFEVLYNETPIKHQLKKYQDELYQSFRDEKDDAEIMNQLNIYGEINYKEYVYVPFCLCLISRYPFIEQMEKCLESIMISINKNEGDINGLNKLITYIVKSIPAPKKQSTIFFPLPYYNKFVTIEQPYFKDINQFGDNPLIILNILSPNHILSLFKLLIFEQKVLVVGKNNDLVSQVVLNFASLIYPFEWIHTYIPIMSEKMIKFLQAFLPFFNGMNNALYVKAIPILAKAAKGVFIFHIDEDKIEINSNLKQNIKYTKASSYIKKHFPSLPKSLENLILKELKSIKYYHDKAKENYDKFNANLRIKNLFIYVFTELLQEYKKYSYIIDDYPVFNSFLMIKEKKSDKKFFKEFTGTQLFQMFIQNSLFNDKENTYFEQCLTNYMDYKSHGLGTNYVYPKFYENLKNEYASFFEIKNNYIIIPYFLKKKFDEYFINKNKSIKLNNVSLFLSKQYDQQLDENINFHGVLKENKRIIKNPIKLNNENDPETYDLFLLPEQDINNLIYDNNQQKEKGKSNNPLRKSKTIKIGMIREENDDKENNIKITQLIPNREDELSEEERDEIKDNIREIMTRIYRSDVSKLEEDKKTIMSCMEKQFGRDYFVSILNTGNISKRDIKTVIEQSYDFFNYVIFNSLLKILNLEENNRNYLCAIKLLKACLCIKATKNRKEIILSDDLFYKLEDYNYFKKAIFWKIWVEDDLTTNDMKVFKSYKIYNEKNNTEYAYMDEEDEDYQLYLKHSYSVLEDLTSTMIKLKLKNSNIISFISDLIKEYIIKEKDYQQLMHEVVNELKLYKQLSTLNL